MCVCVFIYMLLSFANWTIFMYVHAICYVTFPIINGLLGVMVATHHYGTHWAFFCSSFTARKCSSPLALLSHLEDNGSSDPHVAHTLLRHCASFCKLIHIARGTPSSSMVEAMKAMTSLLPSASPTAQAWTSQ